MFNALESRFALQHGDDDDYEEVVTEEDLEPQANIKEVIEDTPPTTTVFELVPFVLIPSESRSNLLSQSTTADPTSTPELNCTEPYTSEPVSQLIYDDCQSQHVLGTEDSQSVRISDAQSTVIENNQQTLAEDTQLVLVEDDQLVLVEYNQPALLEYEQPVLVDDDQPALIEGQSVLIEDEQSARGEDKCPVLIEHDQPKFVEDDQPTLVEHDQPVLVSDGALSPTQTEPLYIEDNAILHQTFLSTMSFGDFLDELSLHFKPDCATYPMDKVITVFTVLSNQERDLIGLPAYAYSTHVASIRNSRLRMHKIRLGRTKLWKFLESLNYEDYTMQELFSAWSEASAKEEDWRMTPMGKAALGLMKP